MENPFSSGVSVPGFIQVNSSFKNFGIFHIPPSGIFIKWSLFSNFKTQAFPTLHRLIQLLLLRIYRIGNLHHFLII